MTKQIRVCYSDYSGSSVPLLALHSLAADPVRQVRRHHIHCVKRTSLDTIEAEPIK
jgi:hypothetical protein